MTKPFAPAGACDSHMHVVDGSILSDPTGHADHPLEEYLAMRDRLGLERCVVVQPSFYGFDNSVTLDALRRLGDTARAVVVVPNDADRDLVARLHVAGARGVRVNLVRGGGGGLEGLDLLAATISEFGWHLQIVARGEELPSLTPHFRGLAERVEIVVDHMGRIPQPHLGHPDAIEALLGLLDTGRVWVKLSAPYLTSAEPDYAEIASLAARLIAHRGDRLLWGSDWPHTTEEIAPDDGRLLGCLDTWARSPHLIEQILVRNPVALYGFGR